jgi:Xaa-Pro aminopeptidase
VSAADRRERAREELARRRWGGLLATPSVNFTYLTGTTIERTERLTCLGMPQSGEPWLVCPAFEAERMSELASGVRIVPWREADDPFRVLAREIAPYPGTWALEPTTAYHAATRLVAAAPGLWLADGAPLFERLRRSKSIGEVAALRRAIDVAWEVYDAIAPTLAIGDTEAEVARRIVDGFAERGSQGWTLVQFGPASAVPHSEPQERALEGDTAVLLDWGGWREGFTADLTRSFWWDGGPVLEARAPAEFRRVLETVRAAQAAALAAMGPGAICGDVDRAARSVIEAAGWGERFVHRLGHGLGREIHEPPYLVQESRTPLEPGDVVTVEPGVYLPGRFGVRWEDDVLVTQTGIEVLSRRVGEEAL